MPKYEKGDFIKVEFRDEVTSVSEWMWVRVQYSDDENQLVFGVLDDIPSKCGSTLRLGTELAIRFDRIRDHRRPSDFDLPN